MSDAEPAHLVLHAGMASRYTGYLLGRLGIHAARRFDARIRSVGLSRRQWSALNGLDSEGAVSQQQLARAIGMDPSTMVATIDELEATGLVQRGAHPTDRRAHSLRLTPTGRRTLQEARRLAGEAQRELLAPLDDSERAALHELLLKLAQAVATDPEG